MPAFPINQLDWRELLFAFHSLEKKSCFYDGQEYQQRTSHYTLQIITKGTGLFSIEQENHHGNEGDCFLLPPGTTWEVRADGAEGLEYCEISFAKLHGSDQGEGRAGEGGSFLFSGKLASLPVAQLLEAVQDLSAYREDAGAIELLKRQIRFQELLCSLFAKSGESEPQPDSLRAVEQTIHMLSQSYCEHVSVELLAQQAQLGTWQYRKLFKKITGLSPNEYVTELRINRAKEMLLSSKERLRVIAKRVGYHDEYYFNRRFKQKVGLSPGQYVRTRKQQPNVIALTHMGEMFSLGMRPVAAERHLLQWMDERYVAGIDALGGSMYDVEKARALCPDLILANRYTDPQLLEKLRNIAPIVQLTPGVGAFQCLQDVADLFDKHNEANSWIERYHDKAEQVRQAARPHIQSGETAVFVHVVNGELYLYRPEEMPVLYDVLGFAPPAKLLAPCEEPDGRLFVAPDALGQYEADRLFIVHGNMPGALETYQDLLTSPGWEQLPAVQANRVYHPDHHWTLDGSIALEWQLDGMVSLLQGKGNRE